MVCSAVAAASRAAYVSNRVRPSFPKGLEVEVATVRALTAATHEAEPDEALARSPFALVRGRPDLFSQAHCSAGRDWSHLDWRVKTPADYAFARAVYDALHPADPGFCMRDVLDVLQGRQDLARWAA